MCVQLCVSAIGVCARGLKRERERKCWVVKIFSPHDCPNTVSFPASLSFLLPLSLLFLLLTISRSPFLFLPFFSLRLASLLSLHPLLSCVTFPLIYPLNCNRNHPRYSLISGQSYQRLFSELGLIAGMLMTHRMGSWAPECRRWRWSQLCCPKPLLQIWPEKRERRFSHYCLHYYHYYVVSFFLK